MVPEKIYEKLGKDNRVEGIEGLCMTKKMAGLLLTEFMCLLMCNNLAFKNTFLSCRV